jgi:hypothetical protein
MLAFGPVGFDAYSGENKLDQECDSAANQCHDKNSQKGKTQMVGFVKFNYPADNIFHPFAFTPPGFSDNEPAEFSIPATSDQTPAITQT